MRKILVVLGLLVVLSTQCLGAIYLIGGVGPEMYLYVMEQIEPLVNKGMPINIVISTTGGSVDSAIAIHDYLQIKEAEGFKIVTKAMGYCYSSGVIILQGGTVRKMSRNGMLLIHAVSLDITITSAEEADEVSYVIRQVFKKRIARIIRDRTMNMTAVKMVMDEREHWIGLDEALKLNLIDEVL